MTELISSIEVSEEERRSENYVMINVRPGEKISAMLDVLSHLFQKTPSVVINGDNLLSEVIAGYAASTPLHGNAVLEAVEKTLKENGFLSKECALELLEKAGVLELKRELYAFSLRTNSDKQDGD